MKLSKALTGSVIEEQGFVSVLAEMPEEEAAALVSSLPSEELLVMLRASSQVDALILVGYAQAEQLCRMIDVEAWSGDQLEPARAFEWFDLAHEASADKLAELMLEIDPEYLTLLLMKCAQVWPKAEFDNEQVPYHDELQEMMVSPDQGFVLIFDAEDPMVHQVKRLIDHLYAVDFDRARQALQAARWELASGLEEALVRFRGARLEEMGIPGQDEAWALFKIPTPAEERELLADRSGREASVASERLTDIKLIPFARRAEGVLEDAIARLTPRRRERFWSAVAYLTNKVVVARGGSVGELAQLRDGAARVADMLRIALECYGPERSADRLLADVHPANLFRLAHGRVARLGLRAGAMMQRLGHTQAWRLFDAPYDEFLEAILRPIPEYVRVGVTRVEVRGFESFADVQEAGALLDTLEAWARFYQDFLNTADATGYLELDWEARAHVTFTTMLATGMCNRMLDLGWSLEPLDVAGVEGLLPQLFDLAEPAPRELHPALARQLEDDFESYVRAAQGTEGDIDARLEHLTTLLARTVRRLEEVLGALKPGAVSRDWALVGSLLLTTRVGDRP